MRWCRWSGGRAVGAGPERPGKGRGGLPALGRGADVRREAERAAVDAEAPRPYFFFLKKPR